MIWSRSLARGFEGAATKCFRRYLMTQLAVRTCTRTCTCQQYMHMHMLHVHVHVHVHVHAHVHHV